LNEDTGNTQESGCCGHDKTDEKD